MREEVNRLNEVLADLYQYSNGKVMYYVIMCHCVQGIFAELYFRSSEGKIDRIWFATCETPSTASRDIRAYVITHQWTLLYPL